MGVEEGYNPNKKSNKKTIILTVLIGLAVICLGIIGLLFIQSKMQEKSYSESIKSAEKYLAQNNYEDAIIAYKKAISANAEEEEGYLALAEVYMAQENPDDAKDILEKGYAKTNSPKIKYMIEGLMNKTLSVAGEQSTFEAKELAELSVNITWNMSLIQKLEKFSFEKFNTEFGNVKKINVSANGFLEVIHNSLDATCYYRNTEDNQEIVDTSRDQPNKAGMPEKISLGSIAQIFRNFEGGVTRDKLELMSGRTLKPITENGKTIIEIPVDQCLVRVETDTNGNIISSDAWNEILLLNANKEVARTGHFSGTIINATTDEGVIGAAIRFEPSKADIEEVSTLSGASGAFEIELEPDIYKMTVTATGFVEESFEVVVEEDENYSGELYTISPELASGSARIVLEWGAEPRDLDSHLEGTLDDGTDVRTNFSEMRVQSQGETIAELDVDNMSGYGPETTTIYNLNGIYRFWVRDYTGSGTMKNSGATVKVYLPGKEPVTITIDPNSDIVNKWSVFELDRGVLKILNEAWDTD